MAESKGFEPLEPVKARQFSKLLLSTTQPTLQYFIVGQLALGRTSSSSSLRSDRNVPRTFLSTQPTLQYFASKNVSTALCVRVRSLLSPVRSASQRRIMTNVRTGWIATRVV